MFFGGLSLWELLSLFKNDRFEYSWFQQCGLLPWVSEGAVSSLFTSGFFHYSVKTGCLNQLYPNLEFNFSENDSHIIGAGCSMSKELAMKKASFEAFERFAATVYSNNVIEVMSCMEAVDEGFDISDFHLLHTANTTFDKWSALEIDYFKKMRWVQGVELSTKKYCYVPFVMTYIYSKTWESEQFYAQNTSGVAAHTSYNQALISALMELVERDAAEGIWLTKSGLREIQISSLGPYLRHIESEIQLECVDHRFYDATTDVGIPTVYSVRKIYPPIGNDVIVTCASSFSFVDAIVKTYEEAMGKQISNLFQSDGALYSRFSNRSGYLLDNYQLCEEDLSFVKEHPDGPIRIEKLLDGQVEFKDANHCLKYLIELLLGKVDKIYVVNITNREVSTLGACVVRAIIPSLLMNTPSNHLKYVTHKRLNELAAHFKNKKYSGLVNTELQPFA